MQQSPEHPSADMLSPSALVDSFSGNGQDRYSSFVELRRLGAPALPAVRRGLRSANWRIRQWCAITLDHLADGDALDELALLVRDPHFKVRLWAVHALACDHCKPGVAPHTVDAAALLAERATQDEHPRVRKMAVMMLAHQLLDERAIPVLRQAAAGADAKTRLHAERGLARYRDNGLLG